MIVVGSACRLSEWWWGPPFEKWRLASYDVGLCVCVLYEMCHRLDWLLCFASCCCFVVRWCLLVVILIVFCIVLVHSLLTNKCSSMWCFYVPRTESIFCTKTIQILCVLCANCVLPIVFCVLFGAALNAIARFECGAMKAIALSRAQLTWYTCFVCRCKTICFCVVLCVEPQSAPFSKRVQENINIKCNIYKVVNLKRNNVFSDT